MHIYYALKQNISTILKNFKGRTIKKNADGISWLERILFGTAFLGK
jgi:hypothetical protein